MTQTHDIIAKMSETRVAALLALGLAHHEGEAREHDQKWAALEEVLKDVDRTVLLQVLDHLHQPILNQNAGPFSIESLTDLDEIDRVSLKGKTYVTALQSADTTSSAIRCLAGYGRMMLLSHFPQATQLTGYVITNMAQIALANRGDETITDDDIKTSQSNLSRLCMNAAIPAGFSETVTRITKDSGP